MRDGRRWRRPPSWSPGLPEKSYSFGIGSNQTDFAYINSDQYRAKFNSISKNPGIKPGDL